MKLEHTVRWQYLFEAKRAFDSTPLGWHSFGRREAGVLESQYQAKSDAIATIKAASSGYEYSVDMHHMMQRNRSTGVTRRIRRLELPLRRVTIEGGHKFSVDLDLEDGETVEWFFEVEGGAKIDFKSCFVPAGEDWAARVGIQKATWHSIAGDFTAPRPGQVHFTWENYYKIAAPRALLLHCQSAPSGVAAGGEGRDAGVDGTLEEFIDLPASQEVAAAPAKEEAAREKGSAPAPAGDAELVEEVDAHADGLSEGDCSDWEVVDFDPGRWAE